MSKHEFNAVMLANYGEDPWMSYHEKGVSPYSQYPFAKMEHGMKALPELDPITGPHGGFYSEQNIMRKVVGNPDFNAGRHRKPE